MKSVRILEIRKDTHDVMHIVTEKPQDFQFSSGQAAEISIAKPDWEDEKRPFTFTSLPKDDYLEFFIKVYPDHDGVTEQIAKLSRGDTLKIGDVFGAIEYKGDGVFIAGGAGVTPFVSILKNLDSQNKIENNKLIFANKTFKDIIQYDYFSDLLGSDFVNVLSEEDREGCKKGFVDKDILKNHLEKEGKQYVYLCGPPKMMDAVLNDLKDIGISDDRIVKEDFD